MNKKWLPLLFAAGLLVVLSACSPQPDASAQQAQQGQTQPRTITVSGNGKVYLTPDVAYISIGVQSQSENVGDALTANNTKSQEVSKTLQDLGVQAKDIQTTNFNIYPMTQTDPEGKPKPTIFTVDNSVNVTVRDLGLLGKLLDGVVRSGANSINGINFDVVDRSKALSEARKLAVEDARKQADEIAAAAGVTIDSIQTMNINVSSGPGPLYDVKAVGAGSGSQVPVSAGQLMISVDVNASYLIK
jgi:uncharacterized protein